MIVLTDSDFFRLSLKVESHKKLNLMERADRLCVKFQNIAINIEKIQKIFPSNNFKESYIKNSYMATVSWETWPKIIIHGGKGGGFIWLQAF